MTQLKSVVKPVWVMQNVEIANTANADTARVSLNDYRRALFCVFIEASANDAFVEGEEITLTLDEAVAITGGLTAHLKEDIEVVGGVGATEALLWVQNAANDDTVTVNGVAFEKTALGYDAAARPLEWDTPAELITAINAAELGVTAHAVTAIHDVRLTVNDMLSNTVTVATNIAAPAGYASTLKACAIVEARAESLSTGRRFVYLNIDNDATDDVDASVVALMSSPYHAPVNQVVAVEG